VLRLLATTFHFFGARLYFPTTFDAKRHLPLAVSVMDYEEMTNAPASPTDLISELNALAASATSAEALMKGIVAILHGKLTRYNWVGFYMLEKEADRDMLVLGPFQGTMTPHTRIPLNKGICGAAASRGKTIVVDDVCCRRALPGLFPRDQIGNRRTCFPPR
jgi:hypothetical protein